MNAAGVEETDKSTIINEKAIETITVSSNSVAGYSREAARKRRIAASAGKTFTDEVMDAIPDTHQTAFERFLELVIWKRTIIVPVQSANHYAIFVCHLPF